MRASSMMHDRSAVSEAPDSTHSAADCTLMAGKAIAVSRISHQDAISIIQEDGGFHEACRSIHEGGRVGRL
jgi:hypothetical protein